MIKKEIELVKFKKLYAKSSFSHISPLICLSVYHLYKIKFCFNFKWDKIAQKNEIDM